MEPEQTANGRDRARADDDLRHPGRHDEDGQADQHADRGQPEAPRPTVGFADDSRTAAAPWPLRD